MSGSFGTAGSFETSTGLRLAYTLAGDGPLLVCHPGGPGRAAAYLEDLGGLAASRTLLMVDARGTGASAAPADPFAYGPPDMAADLDELRVHLGLETFDLLGHSAGALVALEYLAGWPGRLNRLVLVATGDGDQEEDRRQLRAARSGEPWYPEAADAAEGLAYAPPGERARLERLLRPFWYGRWTDREQAHAASADGQLDQRVAQRFVGGMRPPQELVAALGTSFGVAPAPPTLVVAGELDGLTPPAGAERLAAQLPGARSVVLPAAGHFPWVDAPDAFRAAVEDFL